MSPGYQFLLSYLDKTSSVINQCFDINVNVSSKQCDLEGEQLRFYPH